ncbi:hypothetical protein [Moritella sp. Urea-trap-13]|uniref:hypothetical protein n=1 Tax=Moritella sp. Urea-trap-13 TaxID=2058327 RepID=UPI000C339FB1|nr:hypothetical protein [Moritella sp. Urea-trap-13]PKH08121.1 hypothetical protein CXF93_05445 [Moritella sp. Urea-trap-13]
MKKKLLVIALGFSSSILLAGCGGGGGGGDSGGGDGSSGEVRAPVSVFYNVKVIDGYLKNAQVWLDTNGNKQLDVDEPSALSGDGGVAKLDVTNVVDPEQYSIYAQIISGQTVDEDSGIPVAFDYMMSAPPGEQEITPLSTLVSIEIEQNTDGSETDEQLAAAKQAAVAKVANDFGIAEGDVLSDYIANISATTTYVAENIVSSKILPDDENEFTLVIADGSDDATTFNKLVGVVSDRIENIVKVTAEEDFAGIGGVFDSVNDLDLVTDNDADGIPNAFDDLPDDASDWLDTDGDNIGNIADPDDDNDGFDDGDDKDPLDPLVGEYEDCDVSYAKPASIDDFNAQLATCDVLPGMNLEGNTITRIIPDSGQTRTYTFNIDKTADFYQNGVQYYRLWNTDAEGNVELYYGDQTLEYVIRLIDNVDGQSKFAVYANGSQSIYSWGGFVDIDLSIDVLACAELDSGDAPLVSRSYAEFKSAVTSCQSGKLVTAFSSDFINKGMILTTGNALSQADDVETYQFNEDGTGTFTYNEGAGDISIDITWTIFEEGVIKVALTYIDENDAAQTANDYLAIVETNGINYSVKVFSRSTDLEGLGDAAGGDLWSTVMSVPDTE